MKYGRIFFDANKDGGGGDAKPDPVKALTDQVTALTAKLEELSKLNAGKKDDSQDKSLNDKVKDDQEARQKKEQGEKSLESALTFTLKSNDFLKEHEAIFPKEMTELFKVAEKERYDSPIQKANAIKAGIIQEFFNVQANLDLLTENHKSVLADYLKLSKNGKEEKAQSIFENIFEPALGMLKQVKKAEELTRAKNGFGNASDSEKAYKEKLMKLSQAHYMGVK